jgi:hypothetical protein
MMDSLVQEAEFILPADSPLQSVKEELEASVNSLRHRFRALFPLRKLRSRWVSFVSH